jgi:hypothetical protein
VLEREDAEAMGAWDHGGGFSLDASARIEADDRRGPEGLLRYCARPAFALERLHESDPEHGVYESDKPGASGSVNLMLTRSNSSIVWRRCFCPAPASPPLRRAAGSQCGWHAAERQEAAVRLSEAEWLLWVNLGPSTDRIEYGQVQALAVVQDSASERQVQTP